MQLKNHVFKVDEEEAFTKLWIYYAIGRWEFLYGVIHIYLCAIHWCNIALLFFLTFFK